MIISMRQHATQAEIDSVCERIREFGYKVHSIVGEERVVIGVVGGHYPPVLLIFSVLFIAASAGLVASFRWAWALGLAAVFSLMSYNAWIFSQQRSAPSAVQGLLNLVFFLYLIRPEVRSGLR